MVNLHVQHKEKQKILSYINQYYHFLFLQNSVKYIVKNLIQAYELLSAAKISNQTKGCGKILREILRSKSTLCDMVTDYLK